MTSTTTMLAEETATVLAALRYWQQQGMTSEHCRSPELEDIATNGGSLTSLADEDIEGLCERLNDGDPIGGKITNAALYLRTYEGKLVQVEALFPVLSKDGPQMDEPANQYMAANPSTGLLAICNGIALIARHDDRGITEAELSNQPIPEAPAAIESAGAPTVSLSVPLTAEFVGSVLCTMIESGYPWFEWRDEERMDDPADPIGWRYGSALAVEIDDEDQSEEGEGQRRKIDGHAIAEAIGKILRGGMCRADLTEAIAGGIASMDAGMIDADAADCIAQVAVFDEIRYG